MPLQLPNLDDRSYADLMTEARALIPRDAAAWTNHNPSDPGITVIELFAYLAELLIYRVNRITDANVEAFLRLLNGPDWNRTPGRPLEDEVRDAVLTLRRPHRAVTCTDFETLAREADPHVVRVACLPRRDFDPVDAPGHVSVVVWPPTVTQAVADYLEPRRLLTTRVHVVGPRYVVLGIRLTVMAQPDVVETALKTEILSSLRDSLDPVLGGVNRTGWPFGRNVYASEIYELVDQLPGVDYVTRTVDQNDQPQDELIVTRAGPSRIRRNPLGDIEAVELLPGELVDLELVEDDITVLSPLSVLA